MSLRAAPEPCAGETARLTWSESPAQDRHGCGLRLVDFLIDKGSRVVVVGGQATDVSRSGITVLLPERCYATSRRRMTSGSALVHVTLSRNGSEATGLLRDFGGGSSECGLLSAMSVSFRRGGASQPLQVALTYGKTTVYNGKGLIKRRMTNGENIDSH